MFHCCHVNVLDPFPLSVFMGEKIGNLTQLVWEQGYVRIYHSIVKKHPWAEHLKSAKRGWVGGGGLF